MDACIRFISPQYAPLLYNCKQVSQKTYFYVKKSGFFVRDFLGYVKKCRLYGYNYHP